MSIVHTSRIQTLRNSVRADVGPRTLFLILNRRQEVRVRETSRRVQNATLNWNRPNTSKHLPNREINNGPCLYGSPLSY